MSQGHTWLSDTAAALVVAGAAVKLLPAISVIFGVCYYTIGIWESKTGLRWRKRWRGLYFHMRGLPNVDDPIDELRAKLDDIKAYQQDRLMVASVIAMCLALGGTGFAIALLVVVYGI